MAHWLDGRAWADGLAAAGRIGLGACLIVGGVPKLARPQDFLGIVYDYELVSRSGGLVVAMALPALELLLGACLVLGVFLPGALLGACLLFAAFTAAVGSAIWRQLPISCGCFGADPNSVIDVWTLARTGGLLVGACLIWLHHVYGPRAGTGRDRVPVAEPSATTDPAAAAVVASG